MKKLLAKIRKILKDRRTRQLLTRIVSITAAVVVFITTYALVLPAITMESEANCGIPAHQHDDSCYEDRLICGQVESPGHQHTDSCYSISKSLICTETEHQHDDSCFDADGNLTCEMAEHTHDDSCYEEVRELVCSIPESEGHEHTDDCYERILACGMEAHTHSTACYSHGSELTLSAPSDFAAVATTELGSYGATVSASAETDTNSEETSNTWASDESAEGGLSSAAAADAAAADYSSTATAAGTASTGFDAATSEDAFVPQLEPIFFEQLLTKDTGIYYYHAKEGEEVPENSADIADWKRVDDNTELAPADLLRVYLRYTIPAGALNATNDIARYRLPSNLHLTDQQMEAINTTVNGIANQYVNLDTLEITDTERYNTYLGIEATEGNRKPSDNIDEYFTDHPNLEGQEYINAVVRAENVFDETTEEYLGQDLVFTFTPYTVQENQHEYDAEGQPTKAGQKVNGWLCFDLHMDQIDWSEPVISTIEDPAAPAQDVATENTEDTYSSDTTEATEKVASDMDEDASLSSSNPYELNTNTITEKKESSAEIVFAAKDEIRTEIHLVEFNTIEKENDAAQDDPDQSADESTDNANSEMTDGKDDIADDSNPEGEADKPESANEPATDTENQPESAMEINAETYPAVSFEDTITVQAGTLSTDNENAAKDTLAETAITVSVIAEEETFPLGTTMQLGTVEDMDTVASAVEGAVEGQTRGFHAVDISFHNADGEEIEPLKPIKVSMTSDAIKQAVEDSSTAPVVVHIESPAEPVNPSEHENTTSSDESNDLSNNRTDAVENTEDLDAHHDSVTETSENTPTATIVEIAETSDTDRENGSEDNTDTLTFDAGSFSVYVIVYTVDFHWEVNGKAYEFSIPGGGFVSFYKLVEVLGISNQGTQSGSEGENEAEKSEIEVGNGENTDGNAVHNVVEETGVDDNGANSSAISLNNVEVSEATKEFVADVASVEFSSPELVWVGKVDVDTTVGGLKEANGLEVQYSAELTEEQINEINSNTVESGDWALISVQPFTSEETLTVNMKNGDQFVIRVTDDANPLGLDGNSYSIVGIKNNNSYSLTNTTTNGSASWGGTVDYVTSTIINGSTTTATPWTFEWTGTGTEYLIHNGDQYLCITGSSKSNGELKFVTREEALQNPIIIESREGKYAFKNSEGNAINLFGASTSGKGFWVDTYNTDGDNYRDFLLTLQATDNVQKPGTITTADTSGVLTINLFNYGPENSLDNVQNVYNSSYYTSGLNSHQLKFYSYGTTGTGINNFTGNDSVRPGIVADQLGSDKYPVLDTANSEVTTAESLNYLFGGISDSNVTQYSGLNHLFTLDENGYYHYDSNDNYAYLDGTNFKVYSKTFPEEGADDQYFGVGFFPFNDYDEYYNCIHGKNFGGWHGDDTAKEGHYDHHFGMSLSGNFVMPPDGLYNGQEITYEFSGDDDMWVFIDGVLILDIGGIHNPAHGMINFTNGTVTVNGVEQTNLKEKYKEVTGNDWDDSDFSNHDFRVFYMERGGMYSNLEVTFNLPLTAVTETGNFSFDKVSSENESLKLPEAEFSLFNDSACEEPFTLAAIPVKATSGDDGVVSFMNIPYGTYYMKETAYPTGYQAKTPEEIFMVVVGASGTTITTASGDSVTKVTNQPKKINVEVEKVWNNGITVPGANIEIVLGRYELVEDTNAQGEGTLVIKDSYTGLPDGTGYHVTYTITGPDNYSKTITRTYGDTDKEITETVLEVPAGVEYTVTKQVQDITHYTVNNSTGSTTVTVPKNGSVNAQLPQSTFTQTAYRVRIYAVNNQNTSNLYEYSSNYYPAGSALSVNMTHNTYNWGFFSFTVSSSTGGSQTFTSDGSWQFTNNLNSDIDIYIRCDSHNSWTNRYDWINTPTISGATPVSSKSSRSLMLSARNRSAALRVSQSATAPLLPTPPKDYIYQLDEGYAGHPDTITLSGGTWTGTAADLDAYNEYGPYVYYIAQVNESGLPEGTEITITDEVSLDGSLTVLTVTNNVPTGSLQITKTIQKNGGTDTSATGTFYYAVYNEPYNAEASPAQTPVRTGSIEVTADGTKTVTEDQMPLGTYYVYELTGQNGTPIISGNDGIIDEINGTVYQVTGSGAATSVGTTAGTASLTNNKETVNVEVEKNWQDNNNAKGKRPSELKVTLSNGTEVILNSGNNWKAAINGLQKYNSEGQLIVYTWTEETIGNGYTLIGTSIDSVTGSDGVVTETTTLTNGPDEHYNPTTTFTGTKTWNDDGTIRPDEIVVILYKGEGEQKEEVDRKTLEKKEDGSNIWTYEFTNIPVFDEQGNVIKYSVEEVLPNGYSCTLNESTSSAPGYERDTDNDQVFVNEPNAEMSISTGVNLGFIVIKHGNDFIIWTPRKASEAELAEIKQKVAGQAIGDSEFSQILSRPSENVYGVPNNDIKKGNMTASIYMDGDTVKVHFGNKNWSQLAWGQLAYTYTPGNADLINTQTITSLEFYKKWINSSGEEFDWDNDIQVTVRRNGDNSFSLVYNLAKTDIVNGNTINPTPNNDGDPKIKVSVTENEGVKTYLFTIDGLDYANENNEKYIYTVTETNAQLDGYIAPSYSNTSAPTGATAAYDKGTIINQQAGVELPSTGGPGTNLIYLLGIMLSGFAGTGMLMKRRRRNTA